MGSLSFWHVLLVLAVVLIFFGPARLPGLGSSLGKAIRGFKKGMSDLEGNIDEDDEEREARPSREALPPGSKKRSASKKSTKTKTDA